MDLIEKIYEKCEDLFFCLLEIIVIIATIFLFGLMIFGIVYGILQAIK